MDLYKEILTEIIVTHFNEIISTKRVDFDKIVQLRCYETLCKIKEIIENESLADDECFLKIEEIVKAFEAIGSNGGNRHDFG